jgi:transposase
MELDLETFLTTLYVMTDDLYQQHVQPQMPAPQGPAPQLSDSEVLCLGLAAQWRNGVPWKTERQFVRYALAHLGPLFPGMTSQSAFNRRLRRLWGAFILIQQAVAQQMRTADDCEIMDCVPVPVARGARSFHPGWLADIARIGKGGNDRFFYGLHLLLVINRSGAATGWTLAAGNVQDRWLAELLLSSRAGITQLSGPSGGAPEPPTDWVGPAQSCGSLSHWLILADLGYDGEAWYQHWAEDYGAQVITSPEKEHHKARKWFSSLRQVVETAFSSLCDSFGLQFPRAHTRWGLLTRIAAKLAAYNLGILINRTYSRPDFAFGTLIV